MTTLFIDKRNLQLKVDSEALIFYDSNTAEKLGTVPIRLLERICIHGDLQLSASVLGRLGQHGIGLLVLNGRKKEPVLMMPNFHSATSRRKKSPPASKCGNLAKHTDKYCRLP